MSLFLKRLKTNYSLYLDISIYHSKSLRELDKRYTTSQFYTIGVFLIKVSLVPIMCISDAEVLINVGNLESRLISKI